MKLYDIAKLIVSAIFYPLFRIKVIGKENIPKNGPVIICSNHISNLDPPVVGITNPRTVYFMAKEELFDSKLFGGLLRKINAFPVKRGVADRTALKKGIHVLRDGHTLGLFPEGTRSKTGQLGKPLAGVGFFALKTDAQVIPCAIKGTYKPFRKLEVRYGKPMDMHKLKNEKAGAKETSEAIMMEIKKLLDK
ncbi:lysophospholipid acyltransferase family protein [Virgibacillus sp. 179-BFC.A HS]|uniref:Lysophospholipid acyltransferase family protein n=1 Tax=Tigheibacillus jepli TaxID=3035914 RepID=A0ABU5CH57_9BACI|nr:lysophospholipid acyltransferase family protein [Virgibacillus sp. 179-BFC.A HS]MDY0405688.1 lysophospholipid acyltransferase family protein [Virgibacillus sp. 179-BFC.A HS]